MVFKHGPTQPKWPKKEINGEDLLKARFSSRRDGNRDIGKVHDKPIVPNLRLTRIKMLTMGNCRAFSLQ